MKITMQCDPKKKKPPHSYKFAQSPNPLTFKEENNTVLQGSVIMQNSIVLSEYVAKIFTDVILTK